MIRAYFFRIVKQNLVWFLFAIFKEIKKCWIEILIKNCAEASDKLHNV